MTRWRVGVGSFLLLMLAVPALVPYARLAEQSGAWRVWSEADRLESLGANTAKLVLGTLLIVIPAGIAGAVLFYRTDLPWCRLWRLLILLALFIPLPLFTSAWQAALGTGGWLPLPAWNTPNPGDPDIGPQGIAWKPWGQGIGSAIWIHAVAGLPWVILLVGQGLLWVERELEEDASTLVNPLRVLWHVTLPRCRAAIFAAGLWIALMTVTEITVTDMMQVRTFAEEVYTQMVAGDRLALAQAVAVSLPVVLLTAGLVVWATGRWERGLPPMETLVRPPLTFPLGRWRWICFLTVLCLAVVYVAIPVTGLLYKAGLAGSPQVWSAAVVGQHLRTVWRVRGGMVLESLVLAALAGAISAGLALIVCWLSYGARRFQWLVFLVLAVILASSGPVLGLGLKTTIAAILELNIRPLSQALYYGPSPVPALWAHCLRFMPYAVALLWPVMRLLPVELREAIRVDGGRPRHELAYLVWPLLRRATLGAALTVTVLSLGELGASKLVETPGSRTFAHEVFDQMHYGVGNDLAALCLILLGMVLLGGMAMGLFQMWTNRQANRP